MNPIARAGAPASRTGGDDFSPHAPQVTRSVSRCFGRSVPTKGRQLELFAAGSTCLLLTRLHGIPQILVDDAVLGLISDDPLRLAFEPGLAREAAPVVGHLHPPPPVEDPLANVSAIVEHAFTALDGAGKR